MSIDHLQKENDVLKQKLALYEDDDLEKEGYYALKGLVKQQVDIVKEFKLKEEISKNPKDDKFYDRVKAIGEGLKTMITDLKILKVELKISAEEDKKSYRVTPESVAGNIGNTAGQNM